MRKYCNSTDIHPRRQTDGRKYGDSPAYHCEPSIRTQVFLQRAESKRYREANGNRNRYSNKINIYSFTLVHLAYDQMRMGHAFDVIFFFFPTWC